MNDLDYLGSIARLQIQRERLLRGVRPQRTYHLEPILAVDHMVLSPEGPLAKIDGGWVVAVHHSAHPANPVPNRGRMLSIGFTSHYAAMAGHFGSAPPGCAGENILVETGRVVTPIDVAGGIVIERPDGSAIELKGAEVAEPCVPFTRFMIGNRDADLEVVKPHREFLRRGMRGYVLGLANLPGAVEVSLGDKVYLRR